MSQKSNAKTGNTSLTHDFSNDSRYQSRIADISKRFRSSQIRAAMKVNDEMLRFYWSLGRDISRLSENAVYGSGLYKQVSADLTKRLPDVKSFSVTNLHYMVWFYELYRNLPQLGVNSDCHPAMPSFTVESFENLPHEIFLIPWGHQKLIIDKYKKDQAKALFYVKKILENNWSRAVLLNFLDTDLSERQGKAVTNFAKILPEPTGDLAQQITKDPYNFDFLTITEPFNEKEFKDALIKNIERFMLELGKGFAYMGREFRLEIGSEEKFMDMLFYNVDLHCYVVIEVKTTKFEASYLGQLGLYVTAVNHILKKDGDNPTIGLLICKNKDNVVAQYALEGMTLPIGISEYELSKLYPVDFKSSLPSIEEIEAELSDK